MLPYTAADITEMVTDQYSCSNTRDTVQQGPKQLPKPRPLLNTDWKWGEPVCLLFPQHAPPGPLVPSRRARRPAKRIQRSFYLSILCWWQNAQGTFWAAPEGQTKACPSSLLVTSRLVLSTFGPCWGATHCQTDQEAASNQTQLEYGSGSKYKSLKKQRV